MNAERHVKLQKTINFIQENAYAMDMLFLGADDFIGNLIRKAQDTQTPDHKPSRWSHVAMVWDRNLIIESTIGFEPYVGTGRKWDNGVQFYPLRERIKASGDEVALVHLPLHYTQIMGARAEAERLFEQGIKYPILGLLGSLFAYKFFPQWHINPLDNPKTKLYCSAFVVEVYSGATKLNTDYYVDNISPQILWDIVTKIDKVKEGVAPLRSKVFNLRSNGNDLAI